MQAIAAADADEPTGPRPVSDPHTAPLTVRSRSRTPRGVQVTERDEAVLRWVGEQYAVRVDLLGRLLAGCSSSAEARERGWVSPRTVEKVVARWRRAGWVDGEVLEAGRGARLWVWPTAGWTRGLERWSRASLQAELRHLWWCAAVRLWLEAEWTEAVWTSERLLRQERGAGRRGHVPDGVMEQPGGWRAAVEVELSWKGERRTQAIVDDVQARFDRVVYFASHDVEGRLVPLVDPRVTQVVNVEGKVGAWLDRR